MSEHILSRWHARSLREPRTVERFSFGFFVPAVERALGALLLAGFVAAVALPVAWGYEQRQQARSWQETACAYRLREVARGTSLPLVSGNERPANACAMLRQLGFEIDHRR
jgi:hypothetical protein